MDPLEARKPTEALGHVYGAIAEWLLYPEEIDRRTLSGEALTTTMEAAGEIDPRVTEHLAEFCERRETVSLEDYINLLELNPRCPLYLGSHQFEEPKTCNAAGLSDRNTYMLEIANIYRHFGFELTGELPDFLPAMVEFLALTSGCRVTDDAVRVRLIDKLMIQGVRPMARKLRAADSPYHHLVEALEICLEQELGPGFEERGGLGEDGDLDLVQAAATGSGPRLIQLREAPAHG